MAEVILLLASVTNLILLVWFIITLNAIKANTDDLVQYGRRMAIGAASVQEQTLISNEALLPEEIVHRIEAGGARVAIRHDDMGAHLDLYGGDAIDAELKQLAVRKRLAIIEFLKSRKP